MLSKANQQAVHIFMTLIDEVDDITDYDIYNMQRPGYNPYEEA